MIISLLSIRRRIAHHPVRTNEATFSFDESDEFKDEGFSMSWYELYVSENEKLRGKDTEPKTLIITDLVDHERTLNRTAHNLKVFCVNVLSRHIR